MTLLSDILIVRYISTLFEYRHISSMRYPLKHYMGYV